MDLGKTVIIEAHLDPLIDVIIQAKEKEPGSLLSEELEEIISSS